MKFGIKRWINYIIFLCFCQIKKNERDLEQDFHDLEQDLQDLQDFQD